MGNDGGAFKIMEDLDSKELVLKDMELHVRTHHVDTCHIVDNGKEWVRQQVEPHPVVEDLHIVVDKPGYKDVGTLHQSRYIQS